MKLEQKNDKTKEKKPMEQISLKIPAKQLKELKEYANRKGETPISYHIRQAIAEYLEKHN
jgi:metal-responsive CopG/Arc/MetJ family transcriptional regulator